MSYFFIVYAFRILNSTAWLHENQKMFLINACYKITLFDQTILQGYIN